MVNINKEDINPIYLRVIDVEKLADELYECGDDHIAVPKQISYEIAMILVKAGHAVTRKAWEGKHKFISETSTIASVPAERIWSPHNREAAENTETKSVKVNPYITRYDLDNSINIYMPTYDDIYGDDWIIV